MKTYEFSFIVEGLDLDDLDQIDRLYSAIDEVDASRTAGVVTLHFIADADGEWQALDDAHRAVCDAVPDVRVTRVDPDLVGIPDIANRVHLSAEAVRLLVAGDRGQGGFPPPVGLLKGGIRLWEWSPVLQWMKENGRLLGAPDPIDTETATIFNAHLTSARTDRAVTVSR